MDRSSPVSTGFRLEAVAGVPDSGQPRATTNSGDTARDQRHDHDVLTQPAMKRACNECRQQKLRCDVIKDPLTPCSRCSKLQLECKVDANFRRVAKRKCWERQRNDRRQSTNNVILESQDERSPTGFPEGNYLPATQLLNEGPQSIDLENHSAGAATQRFSEASNSPTNFAWSAPLPNNSGVTGRFQSSSGEINRRNASALTYGKRKLDGIEISPDVVQLLFEQFFTNYHPFLPFLDPSKPPENYYQLSPLLFWTIIAVSSRRYASDLTLLPSLAISVPRLLWSTLQSMPPNYHDIKALCILCAWPFPKSNSSHDPTFMLTGTLMHLAMAVGLHMPDYSQDFSRTDIKLNQEDLKDRYATWAACNIVTQSVATGLGQPSTTKYAWSLEPVAGRDSYNILPEPLFSRLRIENFCDRVTQSLYGNNLRATGNANEAETMGLFNLLSQELRQLELDLEPMINSPYTQLYLRCAQLHLRLFALLDLRNTPPLLSLYQTCSNFISQLTSSGVDGIDVLIHCPYYIFQLLLACGFTLLKLLRSPFAQYVDIEAGKSLFNSTISACRKISISNNDLPGRLADVLAQLWAWGNKPDTTCSDSGIRVGQVPLAVKSRMSMSVVYDCLWRWRKEFKKDSARQLTLSAPTNPAVRIWEVETHSSIENDGGEDSVAGPQDSIFNQSNLDEMFSLDWVLDGAMYIPGDFLESADLRA